MSQRIYTRLGKLVFPYWPFLLISTIASLIYVVFNSLSIWLTASLINNILSDFDQLLANQKALSNEIMNFNDQLKYWTNELILRDTPRETLKILCLTILFVFVVKNIFLYIKNISLTYIQFNLITSIRTSIYNHFHSLSLSFFDKAKSGELTSIVVTDVANMRVAFGTSFHRIFVEPVNILMFISLLFVINVNLALYALIIVPVTAIIIFWIGNFSNRTLFRKKYIFYFIFFLSFFYIWIFKGKFINRLSMEFNFIYLVMVDWDYTNTIVDRFICVKFNFCDFFLSSFSFFSK